MKNKQHFLLSILFLFFANNIIAQNFDLELAASINKHPTAFKNSLASFTSHSITPFTIGVPLTLLVTGIVKKDNQLKRDAAFIAGSYVFSSVMTCGLKYAFKERRPFDKYSEQIVNRSNYSGGSSFPSGHTSAAFNLATSLSLRYRKPAVIISSFLYAGTMAWARVYQGVHYPSDVFVGAIIGAGTAWVGYKFQKKLEHKRIKIS